MSLYLDGTDVLGAGDGYALVVRFRDPVDVARRLGGGVGSLAATALPADFIEGKVYEGARKRVEDELPKLGIDADVALVAASRLPGSAPPRFGFLSGALVGLGAAVLWHMTRRK